MLFRATSKSLTTGKGWSPLARLFTITSRAFSLQYGWKLNEFFIVTANHGKSQVGTYEELAGSRTCPTKHFPFWCGPLWGTVASQKQANTLVDTHWCTCWALTGKFRVSISWIDPFQICNNPFSLLKEILFSLHFIFCKWKWSEICYEYLPPRCSNMQWSVSHTDVMSLWYHSCNYVWLWQSVHANWYRTSLQSLCSREDNVYGCMQDFNYSQSTQRI